ncbi:MAG: hypothetical protein HKN68_01795 [Saprospiraceae bacterium]|nr:hypothetical protein [Saprospiraceae bacterium]
MKFRHCISIIGCLMVAHNVWSQNNGIYNGSSGTGYHVVYYSHQDNGNIFSGSVDDGYSIHHQSLESNHTVFIGGTGDGYAYLIKGLKENNAIFYGGPDDGFSFIVKEQLENNVIYSGGSDDGYDHLFNETLSSGAIFAGGKNDGYDFSGMSKIIWKGSYSDNWLMAGNWNLNRIPMQQDQVLIPSSLRVYPQLHGLLRVNSDGCYNYTCRSLIIETNASLTGLSQASLFNNGRINVRGMLHFMGNHSEVFMNTGKSELIIHTGGQVKIGN